jgi:hypothetical protein
MPGNSTDLWRNFAEALRRRLHPNSGIHPKQAAHIAGVSVDTFMRYWRGESRIPAEAVGNLARFFAGGGDVAFLAEVYGDDVVCPRFDAAVLRVKQQITALQEEFGDAPSFPDFRRQNAAAPPAASGVEHQGSGVVVGEAEAPVVAMPQLAVEPRPLTRPAMRRAGE